MITPSVEINFAREIFKEKISHYLVGLGYHEILTNSITNSAYFTEEELSTTVKMLNNLSAELDVMRPSMLETGLETVAYNLNRKNHDLRFFEFGKTYHTSGPGKYEESQRLCLFLTGNAGDAGWRQKAAPMDEYTLKGVVSNLFRALGLSTQPIETLSDPKLENAMTLSIDGEIVFKGGSVTKKMLNRFDIKQPVYFADLSWDNLVGKASGTKTVIHEIPKYQAVQRDLALIVPRQLAYAEVEKSVDKIQINKLQGMRLFDIFESEKLGQDKKSLAVSFTFLDEEKTLTDKEIDGWMSKIMTGLERDLQAEIRK
jgi:phenylalanyl-tRNA synthetase beta chain